MKIRISSFMKGLSALAFTLFLSTALHAFNPCDPVDNIWISATGANDYLVSWTETSPVTGYDIFVNNTSGTPVIAVGAGPGTTDASFSTTMTEFTVIIRSNCENGCISENGGSLVTAIDVPITCEEIQEGLIEPDHIIRIVDGGTLTLLEFCDEYCQDIIEDCNALIGIEDDDFGVRGGKSGRGPQLNMQNPVSDAPVTIEFYLSSEGHSILAVYDMQGRWRKTLFEGTPELKGLQLLKADLPMLEPGMYILHLQTPSGNQSLSFVKL